jgi:hypothetical protein
MTFSLQIAKMVSILVAQESGGVSESRLFAAATAITLIKLRLDLILPATDESVPLGREGNVPLREVGHHSSLHGNITKQSIEQYAMFKNLFRKKKEDVYEILLPGEKSLQKQPREY